mgnify:FL=1
MVLSLLVLALFVTVVTQAIRLKRLSDRWRTMFEASKGENVERMLLDHLKGRMELESRLDQDGQRLTKLEQKMTSAKRFAGLVRYDAFPDVGGQQSFALAVYDEQGHGFVMSSIVGRADCRVYGKELTEGRSHRDLTAEEQRAIEQAVRSRTSSATQ